MSNSANERSKWELAILALSIVGVVWYAFLWGLSILGCMSARKRFRVRPRSPLASAPAASVPGVSILRPLKGLDTNLYENLESTFTQDYPNFEILLSVDNDHDQALTVVRDLLAKYPHVNARILVGSGADDVGINPKVNNLVKAYREAAHDILWVIDSGVMADPGTLARAVDILAPPPSKVPKRRVGVVHHVPYAISTESRVGSRVEEAFLNTNHAKMYIAINTVAVDSCVVGKSCLYRRSDLERVNGSLRPIPNADTDPDARQPGVCGLAAFGKYLAEDNMIAGALWHELGLRHDMSCDVAKNVVGNMSLKDYVYRRARWIRVRKHMVLAATLLEPLTESLMLCLIACASLRRLLGIHPFFTFLLHYAPWLYLDLDVYASLAGHPLPPTIKWEFLAGWFARELLAFPIFLFALLGSQVEWRGRKYQVIRNGEVRRITGEQRRGSWWRSSSEGRQYQRLESEPS
ncbi:glycosyltransferase like family 2-domain-containing protein [Schizophyllum amplum]|uniref:Ceramide glucosyltransferase n=1 Tax=Schizophyllum amplum TaxID=97359 RepID=A0A550CNM8_9AGAR|nr:glycosyltransferase like family 2-domain-containing protein [Auriculariopsis ampla]